MEKITILIADDHTLVRESLCSILNSDTRFNVIAAVESGEEAVELAKQMRPGIVIVDINLPRMNGIEATRLIKEYSPGSKILGLSSHTEPAYARKMIKYGAMGYVTKSSSSEEMIKAIIEIHNNRQYICAETKTILSEQVMVDDDSGNKLNPLSQKETDIIGFIKKGLTPSEIGKILNVAAKTVELYRQNIFKKLKLKNVAALMNYINQSHLATGY
jgi:two-component system invasion response regulator UvrY